MIHKLQTLKKLFKRGHSVSTPPSLPPLLPAAAISCLAVATSAFFVFATAAFLFLVLDAYWRRNVQGNGAARMFQRRPVSLDYARGSAATVLRGTLVWGSVSDFSRDLARSIVHEGWWSVRTVDEFYSAFTVALLPVHPGRRAALHVWGASTLAAAAATLALRLSSCCVQLEGGSVPLSVPMPPPPMPPPSSSLPMPFSLPAITSLAFWLDALVARTTSCSLQRSYFTDLPTFNAMAAAATSSSAAAAQSPALLLPWVVVGLLLSASLWLVFVSARRHLKPLAWWEDPQVQGSRRLAAHSPHCVYPSVKQAVHGLLATQRLLRDCAAVAMDGVPPLAGRTSSLAVPAGGGGSGGGSSGGESPPSSRDRRSILTSSGGDNNGGRSSGLNSLEAAVDRSLSQQRGNDGHTRNFTVDDDGKETEGKDEEPRASASSPWVLSLDSPPVASRESTEEGLKKRDDDACWRLLVVPSPEDSPSGWCEAPVLLSEEEAGKQQQQQGGDGGDGGGGGGGDGGGGGGVCGSGGGGGRWRAVTVPGSWQAQGFGSPPQYTNIRYPVFHPPRSSSVSAPSSSSSSSVSHDGGGGGSSRKQGNPTGLYRRSFTVPSAWLSSSASAASSASLLPWLEQRLGRRRVLLVVKGASSCVEAFVNGTWVGCSKDSFLGAEFDVTDALLYDGGDSDDGGGGDGGGGTAGKAKGTATAAAATATATQFLALRVIQWSDGSYLEDQDQWWLSGLHRSVELHCLPPVHIHDLRVDTAITWKKETTTTATSATTTTALATTMTATKKAALQAPPPLPRDTHIGGGGDRTEDGSELVGSGGLGGATPVADSALVTVRVKLSGPLLDRILEDQEKNKNDVPHDGSGGGGDDGTNGYRLSVLLFGPSPPSPPAPLPPGIKAPDAAASAPNNANNAAMVASASVVIGGGRHGSVSLTTTSSTEHHTQVAVEVDGDGGQAEIRRLPPTSSPTSPWPVWRCLLSALAKSVGASHGGGSGEECDADPSSLPPPATAAAHGSDSEVEATWGDGGGLRGCAPVAEVVVSLPVVCAPLLWTAEAPHLYTCVAKIERVKAVGCSPTTSLSSSSLSSSSASSSGSPTAAVATAVKEGTGAGGNKGGGGEDDDADTDADEVHVEGCRVGLREVAILEMRHCFKNKAATGATVGGVNGEDEAEEAVAEATASHKVLCVNGCPINVRGVNRHEHDPQTGKGLSAASMLRDVVMFKNLNFNATRCSHYPNDGLWYRLCDEMGLYVVDEANIEAHGALPMGRFAVDPAFSYSMLCRAARMALRDKNHASVVLWSLGNETGAGANLEACRRWLQRFDGSRPIQYEGGGSPFEGDGCSRLTDVVCPMYASPGVIRGHAKSGERPVILCEYAHAMGNSTGGLHVYVNAFDDPSLPSCQGGFMWDWCDQGFKRLAKPPLPTEEAPSSSPPRLLQAFDHDEADAGGDACSEGARSGGGVATVFEASDEGRRRLSSRRLARWDWGFGGDFGDGGGVLSDGPFCMNGLVDADRTMHPAVAEVKRLFEPVSLRDGGGAGGRSASGRWVEVRNKFTFSALDASWCELVWSLKKTTAASAVSSGAESAVVVVASGCIGKRLNPLDGVFFDEATSRGFPTIPPAQTQKVWLAFNTEVGSSGGSGGLALPSTGSSTSSSSSSLSLPCSPVGGDEAGTTVWLDVALKQSTKPQPWYPCGRVLGEGNIVLGREAREEEEEGRSTAAGERHETRTVDGVGAGTDGEGSSLDLTPQPRHKRGAAELTELPPYFLLPSPPDGGGSEGTMPSLPMIAEGSKSGGDSSGGGGGGGGAVGLQVSHVKGKSVTVFMNQEEEEPSSLVEISAVDGSILRLVVDGHLLLSAPSTPAFSSSVSSTLTSSSTSSSTAIGAGTAEASEFSTSSASSTSMHSLWRAPTDNDRGGIYELLSMLHGEGAAKVFAPLLAPLMGWLLRTFLPLRGPTSVESYETQWLKAGLDCLSFRAPLAAAEPAAAPTQAAASPPLASFLASNVRVSCYSLATSASPASSPASSSSSSTSASSSASSSSAQSGDTPRLDRPLGGPPSEAVDCVRVVVTAEAHAATCAHEHATGGGAGGGWWGRLQRGLGALRVLLLGPPNQPLTVATVTTTIDVHAFTTAPPLTTNSAASKASSSSSSSSSSPSSTSSPPCSDGTRGATLEVRVGQKVEAEPWVPPLPRVGLRFALPPSLNQVSWLGLGPHECYPDRKRGASLGVWALDACGVEGARVPYARPQEYGGRSDVRWLAVCPNKNAPPSPTPNVATSRARVGLLVTAASPSQPFQASVSPHSVEDLTRASHASDLDPSLALYDEQRSGEGVSGGARTWVHVDGAMMGLGGDDSWSPRVHKEFLVQKHKGPNGSAYENSVWLSATSTT